MLIAVKPAYGGTARDRIFPLQRSSV